MAEESGIQSSLTEEDMKSYLQEVIEEIQKVRRGNNNHRNVDHDRRRKRSEITCALCGNTIIRKDKV